MDLAFLTFLTANLHWEIWLSIHCNKTTFFCTLNNFSHRPEGEQWWIYIYFTALQLGEYPPVSLTLTEVNEFLTIYQTDTKKLVYFFQYTKNWSEIKLLTCDFVSLAAWRWIELGIHFGTSQSAHAKSTIYLFGMY